MKPSQFYKIIFTVPVEFADRVRTAVYLAGAGEQGNYSGCSFSSVGVGRFTPQINSQPAIGIVGQAESVPEERVEVLCHESKLKEAITALKSAHPYEEPAVDIMARFELE